MTKIDIIKQIRDNDNLLSLPQSISEILSQMEKEDFSADCLAKSILKDPSLTGRILALANSPFYHRFADCKTVHQAVSILGVTTVKCMALSSSVLNAEKISKESGVDPEAFFGQTLGVACASERTARAVGYKAPEEAFIAGLLHDIGVLYLIHHHGAEYHKIISGEVRGNSLTDAEKKIFEVDHCEVGFEVARCWGLPDSICKAILRHHEEVIDESQGQLPAIVQLAAALTDDKYSGYSTAIEQRLTKINKLAEQQSLSRQDVQEISLSVISGTVEMAEYLGIDIGSVEDILTKANQEIWRSYLTIENLFKERRELSASLLKEERTKGALESKNVALATLSHYLNNAVMAIFGRSQIMRMRHSKGKHDMLKETLPKHLDVIDFAVKKIVAVLEEMKDISPIDSNEFYNLSQALNIDDRLATRLDNMADDPRWKGVQDEAKVVG